LVGLISGIEYTSPFSKHSSFQVRHRLRKDYGIDGGIPVVFSLEKPKAKLLPFKGPGGEEENPSDYQVRIFTRSFEVFVAFSNKYSQKF
jgi:tRNA A37 threonylcarbamoyladenosine dehydratase